MGIGIANYVYWCNTCGTAPAPGPTTFPLNIRNTTQDPPPSGCEAFEVTVNVYRGGSLFATSVNTKDSEIAMSSTAPTINVFATDTVDVIVEALAPTTLNCQNTYNGTSVDLMVGNAFGTLPTVSTTQSPTTAPTYTFNPVENVTDFINIVGTPTASSATFPVTLQTVNPSPQNQCEAFELEVFDSNNVSLASISKIAGNAPIINPANGVFNVATASSQLRIEMTINPAGGVNCSSFNTTTAFLKTGTAGNMQFKVSGMVNTNNYTHIMTAASGSEDLINIFGDAS